MTPVDRAGGPSIRLALARKVGLPLMSPAVAGSGLNPEQAQAVASLKGPLLILAGAGSGKTTVITRRIERMLQSGIAASSVVAVTFTNKSAREMKERLGRLLSKTKLRGMIVGTFHSLGNQILQREISRIDGYRVPFSILGADDQANVVAEVYRDLKLDPQSAKEDGMLWHISLCKNSGRPPEDYAAARRVGAEAELFLDVNERYQRTLRNMNAVDFDDLILLPSRLLQADPKLREQYQRRWKHFLVDEFQDTNGAQFDFLRFLVGPEKNLCVVGDDDQSIYGWRGARVDLMLNFQSHFPGAATVKLETNYRSTARILKAANAVIANNALRTGKTLRPAAGPGEKLRGIEAGDEQREASLVVDQIRHEMVRGGRDPGHFAILYRTNFQSRAFEQELRSRGIPHHVAGGYRFFDRREVKDAIAYLRLIANSRDETALQRIINRPRRGIGDGALGKIGAWINALPERIDLWTALERIVSNPGAVSGLRKEVVSAIYEFSELISKARRRFQESRSLAPALAELLRDLNFEAEFRREGDNDAAVRARLLNLSELVNMASFMEQNWEEKTPPTLFDFLARISLLAADQDEEAPRGRVQLLTLHLSKGLEFPVVFLTGLEEGVIPAGRSLAEAEHPEEALAEERRLFYVGMTRARENLYLSLAASRRKFGEQQIQEPCRFLSEIPESELEWLVQERGGADADPQNALTEFLSGLQAIGGETPGGGSRG